MVDTNEGARGKDICAFKFGLECEETIKEEINGIKVSIKRKEEVMCKLRKLAESRFITGL